MYRFIKATGCKILTLYFRSFTTMELKYFSILTVVSLVSATPYGYGTKGGASAKAESGAAAGAFGGITGVPVAVPAGAGFSGSFSKSSSSSFSSSSASSSSSSSSYSFSGTGQGGCSTGSCNQGTITSGINGAGAGGTGHAYTAANSAGWPHAGNLGGSNSLDNSAIKFPCATGNCGNTGTGQSYTGANTQGSSYSGGASGSHSFTNGGNNAPCSGNSCNNFETGSSYGGAAASSGSHSSNLGNPHTINVENTIPCSGSNCGAKFEPTNGANTVLTSPTNTLSNSEANEGNKYPCFGSNCGPIKTLCEGSSCSGTTDETKCAYGKCEQSASDKLNVGKPCTAGKCETVPESETVNAEDCKSGQCFGNPVPVLPTPSNPYDIAVTPKQSQSPSNLNIASTPGHNVHATPANTESGNSNNCAYGNCKHSDNHSPKPFGSPGNNANQNYGGSTCNTPNCQSYHYDSNAASPGRGPAVGVNKPATYLTTPVEGPVCSTPNCQPESNSITEGKPSSYNVPIQSVLNKPYDKSPFENNNLPFGASSPNCASGKCSTHSKPINPDAITFPSGIEDSPTYYPSVVTGCTTSNCAKPETPKINDKPLFQHGIPSSPCTTPNCGSIPSTPNPSYGSYVPSNSNVAPHIPQQPHYNGPTATIPNYTGIPQSNIPVLPQKNPTIYFTPTCTTPNCAGSSTVYKPEITPQYTPTQQTPNVPSKPLFITPTSHSPNCNTPNCAASSPDHTKLPSYSGGFGGASGLLKPNDYTATHPNTGISTNTGVPNGVKQPTYTGFASKPIDHAVSPHVDSIAKPNVDSSTHKNLPPYTGGFGGPAGLLQPNVVGNKEIVPSQVKPIDEHLPSYPANLATPASVHKPHGISSGISSSSNYGSAASTTSTSQTTQSAAVEGTLDLSKPHDFHNKRPNLDYKPSSNDKDLPSYNGGFGGPTGLLKPNEFKAPTKNTIVDKPTPSIHTPTTCSSGSCDSHHTSVPTGAIAKAEAVAYTGGFGGPPGLLKPHDNGKAGFSGLGINYATGSFVGTDIGVSKDASTNVAKNSAGAVAGIHSSYDNKAIGGVDNTQTGVAPAANAQAAAVASASATAGGHYNGKDGNYGHEHKPGGCGGGCGTNGGSYTGGSSLGYSGGSAYSKSGAINGWDGSQSIAAASAKSLAGAASDARAFGYGGSAHASATAHASAGYQTKGGYGR